MFLMEEQEKKKLVGGKAPMKKINNFPDKEFKSILIRMLNGNVIRREEHSKNYNKEPENVKGTNQKWNMQ